MTSGMFGVEGSGDTSGYGGLVRPARRAGFAVPPFGGWYDDVAGAIEAALLGVVIEHGEITFHVRPDDLVAVGKRLRDEQRFELCSGVSGVHYPDAHEMHAVYHLLSMTFNRRIRLEVSVPDDAPRLPSLVGVYPTLDWHEREAWDMFGIVFDGHPGLTRILMPDDWAGHPQRKDYPLGGIPVEYKGATVPPPDERRSYQ